jgi:hypothetical protein
MQRNFAAAKFLICFLCELNHWAEIRRRHLNREWGRIGTAGQRKIE